MRESLGEGRTLSSGARSSPSARRLHHNLPPWVRRVRRQRTEGWTQQVDGRVARALLTIGDRTVEESACQSCRRSYDFVKGFVWRGDEPWAVYFAACHGHPQHEAWIDVVLGSYGADDYSDHVTFACRVWAEGAAAVDAPVAASGKAPMFGRLLSRDEALKHDRLTDLWQIIDALSEQDPSVRQWTAE